MHPTEDVMPEIAMSSRNHNTREAFKQTSLYIASFFITYSAFGVTAFATMTLDPTEENRTFYFFWAVLVKLFVPSSGIWNFYIYTRPRVVLLQKRNPHVGRWALLRQVVFNAKQHSPRGTQRPPRPSSVPVQSPVPSASSSPSNSLDDDNMDEHFTPELFTERNNRYADETKSATEGDDGFVGRRSMEDLSTLNTVR